MSESVLVEVADSVATITLNRPEARNALTNAAKTELLTALRGAAADEGIRAVVLTGAGQAFCAGQDLREYVEVGRSGGRPVDTVRDHYNPIVTLVTTMDKPVIAALPGVAAGAGAALALACDFRIATREASLLMAFARIGLSADTGASWTLTRLVGTARATELLMLAEQISAERALELGLLTKVVDAADLASVTRDFASQLASGPTAAYAAIKRCVLYAASHGLAESLEREAELQILMGDTTDHGHATEAFLAKRRPTFVGR